MNNKFMLNTHNTFTYVLDPSAPPIIGNCDTVITLDGWQTILKSPEAIIACASVTDHTDTWQSFPIGMGYHYGLFFLEIEALQLGKHDNTVLCALSITAPKREFFVDILKHNGIINKTLEPEAYFRSLPSYKFVISPEGAGIDTHRTYEALMAGCIPICEDNPLMREKFAGCPILYTNDYSEITPSYLEEIYPKMLHTLYDFSRLFLSFYTEKEREMIKECRRYWIYKFSIDHMITWANPSFYIFKHLSN